MRRLLFYILMLSCSLSVWGQSKDGAIIRSDTLKSGKSLKLIGIPVIFSTPETGFGFGGGGQLFITGESNTFGVRKSNILFTGIYTANSQIVLQALPQVYFGEGDYYLDGSYEFRIYPNKFWGIGNNTPDTNEENYDMTSHKLRVDFLKRLPPSLNFGMRFNYEYHELTEVEEGGLLDSGDIPGSEGAIIVGLGAIFNLDTRDQVEDPKGGYYVNFNAQFSSKNFGATYGYNRFITDLRAYYPLGEKGLLAARIYVENNYGDVPFQSKAQFGGGNMARGYFQGRFIDDQMYVLTAEYRWRFHPRWSLAAFGLMGEVSGINQEFFNNPKFSTGGGVRFKILKKQNTLVRLDVGIGEAGNSGFYFGVNQAF
ncbi:BamA/TamA family outer membrane protein [Robiginitalea aurantiaca]|uniref:BamA/TamA family outer membrane protein n=1 Tax=Robiginitalea aurantiaca TaxID=3056915 RepID=A0ABT7WE84_9FLAO|nr:BamA/TamA family outer membrane protein [Robiginitalea aurantiaca]MDM9631210.1 BamA/TamA family outer membrane protein [Robiginitalea aurantiaca]